MRDLGAVRRLAPKTLEAYRRDLGQFVNFLAATPRRRLNRHHARHARRRSARLHGAAPHRRRRGPLAGRAPCRRSRAFFRFSSNARACCRPRRSNTIRTPRAKKSLPKALTVLEAKAAIATTDELEDRPWVAAPRHGGAVAVLWRGPAHLRSPRPQPRRSRRPGFSLAHHRQGRQDPHGAVDRPPSARRSPPISSSAPSR